MIDCGLGGCPKELTICCYFCKEEGCECKCTDSTIIEPATCENALNTGMNEMELFQSEVAKALTIIKETEIQKKILDDHAKGMREVVKEAMEKYNIKKFTDEQLEITYVPSTKRNSIDSKKLKAEMPDVYNKFLKTSNVSSSVRIKVK